MTTPICLSPTVSHDGKKQRDFKKNDINNWREDKLIKVKARFAKGLSVFLAVMMVFFMMPGGLLKASAANVTAYYNGSNLYTDSTNATTVTDKSSITQIIIEPSVSSINEFAFSYCTGLTNITIPQTVTSIGKSVFYDCTGLTNISIPSSVTSIGDNVFYSCTKLTAITVDSASRSYESIDGMLLNKAGTILMCCPGAYAGTNGTCTIPNTVISISQNAFYNCTGLSEIVIPNGVISIGDSAFSGCEGLKSITLPSGLTSISDYVFVGCEGLKDIVIPNRVTSIGVSAFYSCTGLKQITIPNNVTSIGYDAFYNCSSMTSITFKRATPPTIISNAFNDDMAVTNIYVPFGAVPTYQSVSAFPFGSTFSEISSDATLNALTISSGTLSPIFTSGTDTYTASVDNSVSSVTVTPTVDDSHAAIKVNGSLVTSGNASSSIPLTVGANEIDIVVTAQDGTTVETYVVDVTRAAVVPVANITGVLATTTAGTDLTLSGTATPSDATNKTITWSVKDAGTTGAKVNGNTLSTKASGIVIVTATITNGVAQGTDYTKDFTVTVTRAPAVLGVTVTPSTSPVVQGGTQQFAAVVNISGNLPNTVSWMVSGSKSSATAIDSNGKLTVAADESASTVTVKAISAAAPGQFSTAVVSVIPAVISNNTGIIFDLSGISLPSGVTSVSLGSTSHGNDSEPYSVVTKLIGQDKTFGSLSGLMVYDLKLLDQNGNPITNFTGRIKVKFSLPAGMSGIP